VGGVGLGLAQEYASRGGGDVLSGPARTPISKLLLSIDLMLSLPRSSMHQVPGKFLNPFCNRLYWQIFYNIN